MVKLANLSAGLKHGTVQDKLFLPGLKKLAFLRDPGFFGRMLGARRVWLLVFEGGWQRRSVPPELSERGRRRHHSIWSATGATCLTICS